MTKKNKDGQNVFVCMNVEVGMIYKIKIIFELILLCKQMKILSLIIYPHVVPSL